MVRISKITDYGIVLMTYFARSPAGTVHTARDLSEESRVPFPTVSKILKAFSREGLLESHRGVKGGYSLARPPERISVMSMIVALEGPIGVTECTSDLPGLCDLEDVCPARANWQIINQAVRRALDGLSLAEMTRPLTRHQVSPRAKVGRRAHEDNDIVLQATYE